MQLFTLQETSCEICSVWWRLLKWCYNFDAQIAYAFVWMAFFWIQREVFMHVTSVDDKAKNS